jgi:TPR repeat protein
LSRSDESSQSGPQASTGSYAPDVPARWILAQITLGKQCYEGNAVLRDYPKAIELLRPVAEMDDIQIRTVFPDSPEASIFPISAQSILATIYFVGGDGVAKNDAEAAKWYLLAAHRGDADAQRNLAQMYLHGIGVPQEFSTAYEWCRLAAEQGHIVGQAMLGELYYVGQGVKQDYQAAVKWFAAAAEQGQTQAQTKLGLVLVAGGDIDDPKPEQNVPQNYVSAHMWLEVAAAAGEVRAREERDNLARKMTAEQLSRSKQLVTEYETRHMLTDSSRVS